MGFAYAWRTKQEDGRDLQPVTAVLAQGHMALDVVEHLSEVGQGLVQRTHLGHARGFDLKALRAALQHALVGGAQAFVVAVRQFVEFALNLLRLVDAAHGGHRQVERS